MEPNIVRVDCDTCEKAREIAGETVTIVHNSTYDTYSYTYFCVMCGSRQVHEFNTTWLTTMLSYGCKYTSFKMPNMSRRPGGETINQDDLNKMITSLNSHDHLAAYA